MNFNDRKISGETPLKKFPERYNGLISDLNSTIKNLEKEINEKNIMNEEQSIMEWCRDNFVALDRQRYEIEQQDKLQNAWKALDNMEDILKNQMLNNKENNKNKDKEGR